MTPRTHAKLRALLTDAIGLLCAAVALAVAVVVMTWEAG